MQGRGAIPARSSASQVTGRGLSNAEIAKALVVSESTVQVRIGHNLAKLAAANRTQVAILVHDAGLA
ncbi:LuxR C-terminal-related transcriptional regulator [Amycolatopsis sp. lyj-23]|uniref:LuxR C-terminal-related transcriptional regulator n=1 Tax=Amycolatopsis sp. lyj-23 TaxID=2789283 RepID=UPI003979D650